MHHTTDIVASVGVFLFFPLRASMPVLPCPVLNCGGWTNTRKGKWRHLPVDFWLELDSVRLAQHKQVCQLCYNVYTGHTQGLNGRLPATSQLGMDYLLAAVDGSPTPSSLSVPLVTTTCGTLIKHSTLSLISLPTHRRLSDCSLY